jgi:hypothetical protein
MEQPRPLRRRRRSSRRGAGPPAGPNTDGATDTPTVQDPTVQDPTSAVPTTDAATIAARTTDAATTGVPNEDDVMPSPGTPGDAPSPQNEPVSATANATFAAPAALDDLLAGSAVPEAQHAFAGSPGTAAATGPSHPPEHGRPSGEGPRRSYRTPREDQSERSLRALVTTRSTQVSPTAAMRAREVAVPTAEDLLAAEADLVVVRRHYVPPTALEAGRRRDRTERRPTGGNQSAGQRGPAESV